MKTGTKNYIAKLARLEAAFDRAVQAIFNSARDNVTPFSDCYDRAPAYLRDAYHAEGQKLNEFRTAMVRDARGWFCGHTFYWY